MGFLSMIAYLSFISGALVLVASLLVSLIVRMILDPACQEGQARRWYN